MAEQLREFFNEILLSTGGNVAETFNGGFALQEVLAAEFDLS